VNGRLITQFGQRGGKETAKPGKGISIVPQVMSSTVTLSNLWIAPWAGELPGMPRKTATVEARDPSAPPDLPNPDKAGSETSAKPAGEPEGIGIAAGTSDVVALVNGDETSGTVDGASPGELRMECDAGSVEIPLKRTLLVEFAGAPAPPAPGIRLRLAGRGVLTVQSFKLADGNVFCHSAAAGDLSFPLAALSEIVFQPRGELPPMGNADGGSASSGPIIINGRHGGVIIEGNHFQFPNGGAIQLNGGGIIIRGR
jgi:hypothetical protein